ncbi:MAG: acyltransferase domain-containing protein [Oscillospiraceae bacterium]
MSDIKKLKSFCLAIGLDANAAKLCCDYPLSDKEIISLYELLCTNADAFFKLSAQAKDMPLRYLALYVRIAYNLQSEYDKRGIAQKIYIDTFSDISLWEHEYFSLHNAHGIEEIFWLANHLRLRLFRLGALQFEPLQAVTYTLPQNAKGLPIFNVHIPKGADLSTISTTVAYKAALEFWHYDKAVFVCHSWLLSPALFKLLPPNSRILSFASCFNVIETDESDRQAEERIFGKVLDNPLQYPCDTSLQAAAREYLISKNLIPSGFGWQII